MNPDEDAPNATLPAGAAAVAASDPRVRVLPMAVNSLNNRYHVGARAKTLCCVFVDDDVLIDPEDLIGACTPHVRDTYIYSMLLLSNKVLQLPCDSYCSYKW